MIDVSKIKVGDEVTVKGTVISLDPNANRLGGAGVAIREQWFTPERIVTHTPAPREFKPGDCVTWGRGVRDYEFLALRHCNIAILWNADFGVTTHIISELRHADESE